MVDFIVGNLYKDSQGREYICKELEEDYVKFQFRNVMKRFRRFDFAGVKCVMVGFGDKILAEKLRPKHYVDIDGYSDEKINNFNKHGESYVKIFKKHSK